SASDLDALRKAIGYAWTNKDEIRGRSTLTQQLAKNLYFGTERTFTRKALELVVAGRLERRLGKERILEIYLNTAEWGPGIFGAEAAARHYFGRSASALTLEQAATLAATLPHPLTSNPEHRPSRMLWRRDMLLDRLDPDRLPPTPAPLPKPDIEVAASPRANTTAHLE
ncbi:MAG: biosynthetic peptidoglycan transglycosylase, partial [Gemmatimonadota bacterium]